VSDLTAPLYSPDGKSAGTIALEASVFGIEPNVGVMHEVVNAQLAAARRGTHSTKTRAEVRGGGRKPWRQKGLGRARHGSIRSPIWSGGGVAHGPKPRSYAQRTPKKVKKLALRSALSSRQQNGKVKVIEAFDWSEPKTARAAGLLQAIECPDKTLIVLDREDVAAYKSFRNLPQVITSRADQLSTYDVLWADSVLFTARTLQSLTEPERFDVADDDFVRENPEEDEA
jgi:large subunit ribosomal protein L4